MAENLQLFGNGMPVPFYKFYGETFVLARDGVEFHVDKIPSAPGGQVKAKGTIYLSNKRMVFVASRPVGNFFAFHMRLLYVHGEKFNQPIFHCNNISGFVERVVPDNQNRALYSTHTFKILLKEGGCGTFVPLFLNLIASVRRSSPLRRRSPAPPLQFRRSGAPPLRSGAPPGAGFQFRPSGPPLRRHLDGGPDRDNAPRHHPALRRLRFAAPVSASPLQPTGLLSARPRLASSASVQYVDPNDPTKIFLQQPAPESQLRRRNYHGPADNAY